jgi:magnesium-transporting ATPase (P-type)
MVGMTGDSINDSKAL